MCDDLNPVAVFVAAYPHGARRMRVPDVSLPGERSKRCWCLLPQEAWLMDACSAIDFSQHRHSKDVKLCGLIVLRHGEAMHTLMHMSPPLEALFRYYHRPADCFSVHVMDYARLQVEQQLYLMHRAAAKMGDKSHALGEAVSMSITSQCVRTADQVAMDSPCVSRDGDMMSLAGFLARKHMTDDALQSARVLLLPEPVCSLVLSNQLRQLLLLRRWCSRWPWTSWPDLAWSSQYSGLHVAHPPAAAAIDLQSLKQIASNIRRWAPAVLRDGGEDDDGSRLSLERSVKYLDAVVHGLTSGSRQSKDSGGALRFRAEVLLRSVVVARKLRQRGKLSELMSDHMVPLLPEPLQPLLRKLEAEGLWRTASKSTLQRHQLVLDVCLCMYRRAFLNRTAAPAARYIFADSSPNAGRDFLIVKYRVWPEVSMDACIDAILQLLHSRSDSRNSLLPVPDSDEDDQAHIHVQDLGSHMDEDDGLPELARRPAAVADRPSLFKVLKSSYIEYQCVPVNIALGFSSTQDKAAALAHAVFMECGWDSLDAWVNSTVSITTDMGTELGISSFAGNVHQLLPRWLRASRLLGPDDDVEGAV